VEADGRHGFVIESDRAQLNEIVQRVRDARLRTNVGAVATLDDAVAAFTPARRRTGKAPWNGKRRRSVHTGSLASTCSSETARGFASLELATCRRDQI
jgi:hypothetical protein